MTFNVELPPVSHRQTHTFCFPFRRCSPQEDIVLDKLDAVVADVDVFQDFENSHPGKTIWLMTTLERALHLTYPELERHLTEHYQRRQTFPGTIGGAEISVWSFSG